MWRLSYCAVVIGTGRVEKFVDNWEVSGTVALDCRPSGPSLRLDIGLRDGRNETRSRRIVANLNRLEKSDRHSAIRDTFLGPVVAPSSSLLDRSGNRPQSQLCGEH